ncbi:RelA/SpoT family protein [uncultured Thiothrix sp.]|uniref:RelA/SpoT family protein n=1 Tax=uncultured Thiothrix sp. TaxID=223185 RepID=UPI002616B984|nr:RelA/SpoT family protein [uncultured Thiothrix sp.]HMT92382.1 RelA/SpoT family protein [Thiolinea sp.]
MQHSQTVNSKSRDLDTWVRRLWVSNQERDLDLLYRAIKPLLDRGECEPLQPCGLDVAENLRLIEAEQLTLLAALLSDPLYADALKQGAIEREYGNQVSRVCFGMWSLHSFRENTAAAADPTQKEQAELVRNMLLSMVGDMRAVLIKLAWQLQYLRLLARENLGPIHTHAANLTMMLFAPLANRLGISQIKWELEDLSFRFLEPQQYKSIAKALANTRLQRENYINDFIHTIRMMLAETDIKATVYGRPKHIYSIWKKMQRKQVPIDQLYDLRAIRIIVDDNDLCYEVLSMVHARWPHIQEEFDNYIAHAKSNGYQSIHTVVIGPQDRAVEIQIRTHDMHQFAELGVAAHWRYKEGGRYDRNLERVINSMRRLLEADIDDSELLEDFQAELFSDRVFVVTPKGKVIDLIKGATPIDFAYAIHTDIGHRCHSARVNDRLTSLNYELKNGDKVEIITNKEPRPKMNWLNSSLNFIKAPRTRQKINHWFRQQNHERNYQEGLAILDRQKHLLNFPNLKPHDLYQQFGRQNERDFLIALGRGDITPKQFADSLIRSRSTEIPLRKIKKVAPTKPVGGVSVQGVSDLVTQIAQCCQPLQGEGIIGYITIGRGVSVHRTDCKNILHLNDEQKKRLVDVSWRGGTMDYAVDIQVSGENKPGLVRDVADVLARLNINIHEINTLPRENDEVSFINLTIQIQDIEQLSEVLERLMQLPSVQDAQRRS